MWRWYGGKKTQESYCEAPITMKSRMFFRLYLLREKNLIGLNDDGHKMRSEAQSITNLDMFSTPFINNRSKKILC